MFEGFCDCPLTFGQRIVDAELARVVRVGCQNARTRQIQEPADVLGQHEVPGGPQDVRPQQPARVKRLIERRVGDARDTLTDAPLAARIVLRLHRAQPAQDVFG